MTAVAIVRRKWWLFLLLVLATSQSGCLLAAAGAAAGAGAYAYYKGNVSETCAVEFGDAYQGTKEAMLDLGMPVLHEEHQGVTGTIESSLQDGTKVTVSLQEKPRVLASDHHETEVAVRVGHFGDDKTSTKILQQVALRTSQRKRDGVTPAGSAPATAPGRLPPISQDASPIKQASLPPALATGGGGDWKPAVVEPPKPQ